MLIDSHAHLNMPQFDRDRSDVINRAKEAGVEWVFTVGTDVASSQHAVELSREHSSVYAIVGIHPHNAKDVNGESLRQMARVARDSRVRAYGEIGLDFYRNLSPADIQADGFRRQIRLARDLELPVVIHDRDAHNETLRILQEEGDRQLRVVMHCFSGDLTMATRCLEMGFYLSLPGTITFSKADALRQVVREIPLERLMVETDCPFLTPEPFRGNR